MVSAQNISWTKASLSTVNAPLKNKVTANDLVDALCNARRDHPFAYAARSFLMDVSPFRMAQIIAANEITPDQMAGAFQAYGPVRSDAADWFEHIFPRT